ncbi:TlyA family RNA methyltransferase [Marinospirillum perlucidum]|uniref:TlyA family RNA methyltransferase n=1 Tax=Marinospirillum perlucidum TaxID=1982602 RepID=UPI000DF35200|nr:TlyA family RNA methyltransferase [Marinospirillum perlucidum]
MQRLDLLLVKQQLATSRTQAQQFLSEGRVELFKQGRWQGVSKPGLKLPDDSQLQVETREEDDYVSRGALKLKAVVEASGLELEGWLALDIGQSTGGFTDYLLKAGVRQVVGLDVGQAQLDARLAGDPRVTSLEKVNARYLEACLLQEADLPATYDLIVMDVSFISQTLILPRLPALLNEQGWIMTLVKPQFEVGRENIGKGGLVRNPLLFAEVKEKISQLLDKLGLDIKHWLASPIKGGDGNQEFLLAAQKRPGQ